METPENHTLSSDSYLPIDTIEGIKFTPREIDTLACILGDRSAKKIASFLLLSPRTVENYIRNIMQKLDCSSREDIKDFLENSDKFIFLKSHYTGLMLRVVFEQKLKELSAQTRREAPVCLIIHWEEENKDVFLPYQLKKHLTLAGIKVTLEIRSSLSSLTTLIKESRNYSEPYVLCIIPKALRKELQTLKDVTKLKTSQPSLSEEEVPTDLVLLVENKKKTLVIFSKAHSSVFESQKYYFSFIETLKCFIPTLNVDGLVAKLKQPMEISYDVPKLKNKNKIISEKSKFFLNNKPWVVFIASVFVILPIFLYSGVSFFKRDINRVLQTQKKKTSIRSDLVIPAESSLLNRPELITQIENKLNSQKGIQTIALIGQGGAGKTTLARQYARQKKINVVWEINAETHENLIRSFENLAEALSKTEEDKKILRGVQEIQDSLKREEKIVQYVKEKLGVHPTWVLIYDNVERFTDIQKAFPNDPNTWGNGIALITTRDSNIQNDNQISCSIFIDELTISQKLDLFLKITTNNQYQNFNTSQKKEVECFLEKIPSFPLDVSVAAYYIKSTGVPYEGYLSYIKENNKIFVVTQEDIIKDASRSIKTRQGIIILSLQKLMETHKDFGDLLLFISLLNSQNIPRELLAKYKNDAVDGFIYHLKKYSLIRENSLAPSLAVQTLSIHRSTQAISFAYLTKKLDLEKNKKPIQEIVTVLENELSDAIDQDDIKKMRNLYGHIAVFLNHKYLLSEEEEGKLLSSLGYLQNYLLKDNENARTNIEKSYLIAEKHYKNTDLKLGKILVYLGIVYRKLGEYEKAKKSLQKGLQIYRHHFPKVHFQIGWVLANLGHVEKSLGNAKKAKEILEQAIEIYNLNDLQNKTEYARAITSLGITYKDLGDYKKSEKLLNQSLHIYRTYFSSTHPDMTWVLGFLSDTYRKLEEHQKAKQLLEEGLAIQKKYFPYSPDEENWLIFLLGKVHRELGNYKQAKSFLKQALVYYDKAYGKEHIETAYVVRSLGQTYYLEGQIEMANDLFHNALEILKKNNHSDQYIALEDIADINLKKAAQEEKNGNIKLSQYFKNSSINNLKEAIKIVKIHFPKDCPHTERIQAKINSIK